MFAFTTNGKNAKHSTRQGRVITGSRPSMRVSGTIRAYFNGEWQLKLSGQGNSPEAYGEATGTICGIKKGESLWTGKV